jgi:hypothetical protein
MDWFERLTGFVERDYAATRGLLNVVGERLESKANRRSYSTGRLEIPTLHQLRERAGAVSALSPGRVKVTCISRSDVADLHRDRANENALFQVASQFNLLEMTCPSVTPEDGVTRYQRDHTQGPACAMAAGAATIYRNYFAEIAGQRGQTRGKQIDCLADLGDALGNEGGILWRMSNGYALCDAPGLEVVDRKLKAMDEAQRDALRGLLRIGLHWNVEVTASPTPYPHVSQAFCSALPVAYWGDMPKARAEAFAALVLEGA